MPAYSGETIFDIRPRDHHRVARVALLRDDGPIGTNTVVATASSTYDEIFLLWPDEYDGESPVAFRIRMAVYGWGSTVIQSPPSPYDLARIDYWLGVVVKSLGESPPPTDPLPEYDANDGTVDNEPLFDIPIGYEWAPEGARMMRCNGSFLRFYYDDMARNEFKLWQETGGGDQYQHPHPITEPGPPLETPRVWELEWAEWTTPRLVFTDDDYDYYEVRRSLHRAWELYGRRASDQQWEPRVDVVYYSDNVYPHPDSPYPWIRVTFRRPAWKRYRICVHGIDSSRLFTGRGNRLEVHNLFSLQSLSRQTTGFSGIRRVRFVPRWNTILVLFHDEQTQTSVVEAYTPDTSQRLEVVRVTGTSSVLEIAEDQRTTLLVYSSTDNTVYRRVSRDGVWTWSEPEQCTLASGEDLTAIAVNDLDYSPRLRCWLLSAQTDSQTFKVYASEDGLEWTDAGL